MTLCKRSEFLTLLGILVPPQITEKPEVVKVTVGDPVSLDCKVTGSPELRVKWMKDGRELKSIRQHKLIFENNISSLKIQAAQKEDEGEYSNLCLGVLLATEQVIGPSFIKPLVDMHEILGSFVQICCKISGSLPISVEWKKDGTKISSDGRNHSLSILTDEQEDEGLYTCRAINEAGEIESSGKLRLQAAPQFHPGFPLKEKYFAGAGTSLRLHVVYIGRPIPQIMWFYGKKNGRPKKGNSGTWCPPLCLEPPAVSSI
uniref:Ig-like domain-containing protein n=1 Tax=Oreochromis niloticus TaxID=8128 RepID=A0A669CVS1_ORENI